LKHPESKPCNFKLLVRKTTPSKHMLVTNLYLLDREIPAVLVARQARAMLIVARALAVEGLGRQLVRLVDVVYLRRRAKPRVRAVLGDTPDEAVPAREAEVAVLVGVGTAITDVRAVVGDVGGDGGAEEGVY
jgi:hypothetical protein